MTQKQGWKVFGALLIFGIALSALIWYTHTYPRIDMSSSEANMLRFSTTGVWNPEYFSHADRELTTAINRANIVLEEPPLNDSYETRADIGAMLQMKKERTPEMLAAINAELDITTMDFDGYTVAEYFDTANNLTVTPLLTYTWGDLTTLIMAEKKGFDRTRPHTLRGDIDPVIDVPGHPAYPSGHATQAFFLAYIMSAVYPENAEVYFNRAYDIARHREVAGVHYPSDTAAGAELARQFFEALESDQTFMGLLLEARKK